MKIRIYLSKSRNTVMSISTTFEVGKDNVIYVSYGAVQDDDENIPRLFCNKGYYHCTVKSVSDVDHYRVCIFDKE